jgi:hypothetical protein
MVSAQNLVPTGGSIAYARTCYSHLAGRVGVQIADGLQMCGLLKRGDAKTLSVTASGIDWFTALGIDLRPSDIKAPKFARRCLDWTERRHHLAGILGFALYRRFKALKWVAPIHNSRAVRVDSRRQEAPLGVVTCICGLGQFGLCFDILRVTHRFQEIPHALQVIAPAVGLLRRNGLLQRIKPLSSDVCTCSQSLLGRHGGA